MTAAIARSARRVPRPFPAIRHASKRAFLVAYARCGKVGIAAEAAGIHRSSHWVWMRDDDAYADAFADAHESYIESLEAEADRRAVAGWDEPVFHNGEVVGAKRRHSDLLLIFRLRALRPDVYRERVSVQATVDCDVGALLGRIGDLRGSPVIDAEASEVTS
jgi:hypothetical protein